MKILCVIDSLGSGGAQRQLVQLAIGFKKHGHDVHFLVYHSENFFLPTLEQHGITVTLIEEAKYLKRLFKMRSFIRRYKPDAVLSFLEAANFICELAGFPFKSWKLVVGERNANPLILKSIKLKFFRWFHFAADYVVSNSYANIELVRKINPFLNRNKQKIIYNSLDLKYWAHNKISIKHEMTTKFKLLVVARHASQKNLIGLVEAVNLLDSEDKKKLIINWYGDITDLSFENATKRINELKLNELFNFQLSTQNVKDKILQADAVGLFSLYEGLPNIICESMACSKPVLCSNVSDISSILSHSNELIFDPKNYIDISEKCKTIINMNNSELEKIGRKNRIKAENFFDQERSIDMYLKLLNKKNAK
jgi:glycosyltransferase involved in cell wall biosynthesis